MPEGEGTRYEKTPRPESIDLFTQYLATKQCVTHVVRLEPQIFLVSRECRSDLLVHVTNIYILSEADIYEILATTPKVNAIVTMSAWNQYTDDAKRFSCESKVGLFTFREFMGAVWFSGNKFLDYVLPEDREESNSH